MSIETAERELSKVLGKYIDYNAKYRVNMFALCKAIIKKESDFNPKEVMDEKNVNDFSIGYMQVRIETARWVMGWWLDSREKIKQKLFDPAINIECGVKYLAWQMRRYNGDLYKVIPAYNSGSVKFKDGHLINQYYLDKTLTFYEDFGGIKPLIIKSQKAVDK